MIRSSRPSVQYETPRLFLRAPPSSRLPSSILHVQSVSPLAGSVATTALRFPAVKYKTPLTMSGVVSVLYSGPLPKLSDRHSPFFVPCCPLIVTAHSSRTINNTKPFGRNNCRAMFFLLKVLRASRRYSSLSSKSRTVAAVFLNALLTIPFHLLCSSMPLCGCKMPPNCSWGNFPTKTVPHIREGGEHEA